MSTSSESLLRANLYLPGPQSFNTGSFARASIGTIYDQMKHSYFLHYNFLDTGGYNHVIFSISRGTVGAEGLMRSMW